MSDQYMISCSAVPSALNCMRGAAAKGFGSRAKDKNSFLQVLEKHGYSFNPSEFSKTFAQSVGTSAHKGAEVLCTYKRDKESVNIKDAIELSIMEFNQDPHLDEREGDSTTPTRNKGEQQIIECVKIFNSKILPTLKPWKIEEGFQAPLKEGWFLKGHADLIDEDSDVHDFKFGNFSEGYQFQLGSYGHLSNHHGNGVPSSLFIDHVPRGKPNKAKTIPYNNAKRIIAESKNAIKHILICSENFIKTGNPSVFPANPCSVLCSAKYCPAHGTEFCKVTMSD